MSAITRISSMMDAAGGDYYQQVAETHRLMTERLETDAKSPRRPVLAKAIQAALESEARLLARKTALEEAFRAVCELDGK